MPVKTSTLEDGTQIALWAEEEDPDQLIGNSVDRNSRELMALEHEIDKLYKFPDPMPFPEDPESILERAKDAGVSGKKFAGGLAIETAGSIAAQAAGASSGLAVAAAFPPAALITGPLTFATVSFLGGFASSIAAQKHEGREKISWGRAITNGAITAIPGGYAAKGATTAVKLGRAARTGATIGAGDATARAIIDEGRLPTRDEIFWGVAGGGVMGPAVREGGVLLGKGAERIVKLDRALGAKKLAEKLRKGKPPETADEITGMIELNIAKRDTLPELAEGNVKPEAFKDVYDPLSNYWRLTFPEQNKLIKDLGLMGLKPAGDPKGAASAKQAQRVLAQNYLDIRGDAMTLTGLSSLATLANPAVQSSLKVREGILTEGQNWLTRSFPSMTIKDPLMNEIMNMKGKMGAAELLVSNVRNKIEGTLKWLPDSTIGEDTYKFLTNMIKTPTPAMKPIGEQIYVLADMMKEFQAVVKPFLKQNYIDELSEFDQAFLDDFLDPSYMHRTWRLYDDPNWKGPDQKIITDLKNYLKTDKGADEGFGTFKVITKKTKQGNLRFHRDDNDKPPPKWAFSPYQDKTPLTGQDLLDERDLQIDNHINRYLANSARNKAKSVQEGTVALMTPEDILMHKRETDWPEEYVEFFGGPLRYPVTKKIDYGSIFETTVKQLSNLAQQRQLDYVMLKELLNSGLARSVGFNKDMPKSELLFREGREELIKNAAERGVSTPAEGGRGVDTITFFSDTLVVETDPIIAAAMRSVRFDEIAKSMSQVSTSPLAAFGKEAWGLGIFGTKFGLVALNLASYPTNAIGAAMSTAASGNNPFKYMIPSMRASLSEFGMVPNKKEAIEDYVTAVELGVLDNSVIKESLFSTLKTTGWQSKIMEEPLIKLPGQLYSSIDNAFRYSNWKQNFDLYNDIVPHSEEITEAVRNRMVQIMAANYTNDVIPNYRGVSPLIKKASEKGILPVFVTFNAELVRNTVNLAALSTKMQFKPEEFLVDLGMDRRLLKNFSTPKDTHGEVQPLMARLKSPRSRLILRGAKTQAALAAVAIGSTALYLNQNDKRVGITPKQRNNFRDFASPWDGENNLIILPDKDDRSKGRYFNLGYINQYSLIPKMIGAARDLYLADETTDDQLVQNSLLNIVVEEFTGEGNFLVKRGMEALSGRDERGLPISYSAEEAVQRSEKAKYFINNAFKLASTKDVENLLQLSGVVEGTPRRDWDDMLLRAFGFRMQEFDIPKSMVYQGNPASQKINSLRSNLKREINIFAIDWKEKTGQELSPINAAKLFQNVPGPVIDKTTFPNVYQKINEDYQTWITQLIKLKNSAMSWTDGQMTEPEIIDLYKKAGVHNSDLIDIYQGIVRNIGIVVTDSPAEMWERSKNALEGVPEDRKNAAVFEEVVQEHKNGTISESMWGKMKTHYDKILSPKYPGLSEVEKLLTTMPPVDKRTKLFVLYPDIIDDRTLRRRLLRNGVISIEEEKLILSTPQPRKDETQNGSANVFDYISPTTDSPTTRF